MTEENAIDLAKQYLATQGRSQDFVGSVRIGLEKIQQSACHLRCEGNDQLAEKLMGPGPCWAIQFRIAQDCTDSILCPSVNIVSVYDNGDVRELAVL